MTSWCLHHGDPDGWCAAAIVNMHVPDVKMVEMNYGREVPKEVSTGDTVFMVDFSLQPFDEMVHLVNRTNLIWIDHHISSIKREMDYPAGTFFHGIREDGRAGCELTWEHFRGKDAQPPRIVTLIGRYDVWDKAFWPDAFHCMIGLKATDASDPKNPIWESLLNDDRAAEKLVSCGAVINAYLKTQNAETCRRRAFAAKINGVPVVACNNAIAGSDLFDSVWDENKFDAMCRFAHASNGRWDVSLYSEKAGVDCAKIAESYGGGGHKGAAGFVVDEFEDINFTDVKELSNG